ncbi:MAG: hypothetical protein MK076_00745 [Flavobacteriales bacterium]|nr:hypothetical protein [Flavobacteriales bacterium]
MIDQVNTVQVTITQEDFAGVDTLVIFRQAPFKFTLASPHGVNSPFAVYKNNDYSLQGSVDLIEYIRDLALAQTEVWPTDVLVQAGQAQTIFIIYNDFNDVFLDFSTEVLDMAYLVNKYSDAQHRILSYDTSDDGLVALVNGLITWMETL